VLRRTLKRLMSRLEPLMSRWPHLNASVMAVRDLTCLNKAMGWDNVPLLVGDHLHDFQAIVDLNERRIRDAEVLGAACCNGDPQILLEIGTAEGHSTALMARNAPTGTVYTVNILPDEIAQGGTLVSGAPTRDQIGRYYRQEACTNVQQIFSNTLHWEPDFGPIDVAFIDGSHDADFVFNDTLKVLRHCRPGSLILWHDFAPDLKAVHPWIAEVCDGVERLYAGNFLRGPILHVRYSWIGLHRVSTEPFAECKKYGRSARGTA
jgi:predicted O-methyltransferase YrrM